MSFRPPAALPSRCLRLTVAALALARAAAAEPVAPVAPAATHPAGKPAAVAPVAPAKVAVAPAKAPVAPAAAVAKAAIKGAPPPADKTVQGLLRLAAKLGNRGDYATAEIAYWQILNQHALAVADEKEALLALAHLLRKAGSFTKTAAIYEKFVKEFPNDDRIPDALLELGRALRDMGVYHLAINRFYSVINSTLKFPPEEFQHYELLAKTAQFEIAQTYFDAGEFDEAGKYFGRVRLLDLAPADRARADFMAARAHQLAGDGEDAVARLRAFLLQFPDDANAPEAAYLLATTLGQLHRTQDSLAVTLNLLRDARARSASDPGHWSYWQRRTGNQVANEFFQSGDTFNALAIYRGLSDMSADPRWRLPITYQMALCYERLRQTDDAGKAYRAIIAAATPRAGSAAASPEVVELARMATWRLAHLEWNNNMDRQFEILSSHPPAQSS